MVQPERVTEESKRTERPRGLILGGTIVVFLIAAFTLGRLTAPEVEENASPSTTEPALSQPTTTMDPADFRVVDIQQGAPVRWARAFGIEDMWPAELVEFDGLVYLFGNSGPLDGHESVPRIFTSDDGVFWVERPHQLTEQGFSIQAAVVAGNALMALGSDRSNGQAVVWESADGLAWTPETLPLPRPLEPWESGFINTATSRGGVTYAFGGISTDFGSLITDYLPDEIVDGVRNGTLNLQWSTSSVTVKAPMGVTAYTARFDELGMPDDVIDLGRGLPSQESLVWRSDRSRPWQVSGFDATWVEQAAIDDNGTVTATGYGRDGPTMWVSTSGNTWEEAALDDRVGPIVLEDGLMAVVDNGLRTADVVVSAEGSDWESTGIADLLPDFLDWYIQPLAVGEAGVGFFAFTDQPGSRSTIPDAVVERDGYRLIYSYGPGHLTMEDIESGETIFTTDTFNPAVSAPATVDLSAGTVTFHDPGTQEPLVTYALGELEALEQQALVAAYVPDGARGFVWSRDALTWSIQDTAEVMDDFPVEELLITEDRMIAITMEPFFGGSRPPRVFPWLGLIPSG